MRKNNYIYLVWGVLLLILVFVVGLFFNVNSSKKNNNKELSEKQTLDKKEMIKLGVITPLTGDAAIYGEYAKTSIDLAVEEINNNGGVDGKMINIIYEDDQASPEKSVKAVNKLVNIDNVDGLIYCSGSGATLAGLPILEKNQVPTVVGLASSPDIRNSGEYIFRVVPADDYQTVMWIKLIEEKNYNKPAILYVNNAWGKGLKDSFIERYGKEVFVLSMPEDAKDVRTQLLKIKNYSPDVLLLPCYPTSCVTSVKQLNELNIDLPIISGDVFYNQEYLDKMDGKAEGFLVTHPKEGSGNEYDTFSKLYYEKYGKEANVITAYNYDSVYVFYNAMKHANSLNKQDILKSLNNVNFVGASGLNKFDSFGEVSKDFAVSVVKNGKFVNYK